MGINSMTGFGKKGEKSDGARKGWDYESGSYYVVGGRAPAKNQEKGRPSSYAPVYNKNLSTVHLLDAANPDDPFIAEAQMLERDKSDRLRRQMAAQQKEREIVEKLGQLGSGGAGGEYMRHRAGNARGRDTTSKLSSTAASTKAAILGEVSGQGSSKKRTAENVRLSPVKKKKARFMTEGGIREAGEEPSVAFNAKPRDVAGIQGLRRHNTSDEDDDLDIV